MKIKKEALRELAIFNATCPSIQTKSTENTRYLYECAGLEQDFELENFLKGFPENSLVVAHYRSLQIFAKQEGVPEIDERLVRKFFGGRFHAEMIFNGSNMDVFGQDFALKFLFAHLLIPITITNVDLLSGTYVNGDKKMDVEGLLKHPCVGKELELGEEVFVHFATVISLADEEMKKWLLHEQKECVAFMQAVDYLKKIDYKAFCGLGEQSIYDWTEAYWKECKI